MIKKAFFIAVGYCSCLMSVVAQDFNLIYIQLDKDMDFNLVNQTVDYLVSNELENQKNILLYANSNPITVTSKVEDIYDIKNSISNNHNYVVQTTNVNEKFLDIFKDNEICQLDDNNKRLKKNSLYQNINFHFFVGNDFFDSGFQNDVLANFLFASDLQNDKTIHIFYYSTSNLTNEMIGFDNFYNNNSFNIELR
jgi:hypothetical protein